MSDIPALDDNELETLLGQLADEFTERLNRGEQPDIEEFVRRHPSIADILRQVLPALQVLRPAVAAPENSLASAGPALPATLGDYRLLREIGRGGMGIVYEAEQVSFKRQVALKVLPSNFTLDGKQLARFQREAKTAAQLHHTNIVPVYAVGCEQGVHFYAMQFIAGRSLDHVLNEMRARLVNEKGKNKAGMSLAEVQEEQIRGWPESLVAAPARTPVGELSRSTTPRPSAYFLAVARMGIQVAEALEYAHQRSVIHRDIKPSNLILDELGLVWITDFGLVKCLEDTDANLTQTGDVIGTARYMSPEQTLARRGPIDQRSDIYSLGVTLYELLTLYPAFDGPDHATLLQQIALEEPPAPRQRNRAVPRDLETIVLRALAKNPTERYPTAGALAADLQRFVAGEPIRARPLGTLERAWKWAKRRPAIAALLSLVVIVTAVGFGLVTWKWLEAEEQKQAALAARQDADAKALAERDARTEAEFAQKAAEDRERTARRHLYAAHLHLAQQAWERGHVARVRLLLDGQRPQDSREDLRGFEWYYLWRLCHRDRLTLAGHGYVVNAVAFTPDGKTLATGSAEIDGQTIAGVVKLWDLAGWRAGAVMPPVRTFKGHRGPVQTLMFSPDGKVLATGSLDQTVKLWEVATGEERATFAHGSPVHALAFTPDGKTLAVGCADGTVKWWDPAEKQERSVLSAHTEAIWSVAFAPDGKTLATGSADRTAKLWEIAADQPRAVLEGHTGTVRSVAFAPDGSTLATGSADETVKLWDLAGWRAGEVMPPVRTLKGHTDSITGVAFAPDGKVLATGSGDPDNPFRPGALKFPANSVRSRPGEVKLWNVATGLEQATLKEHTGPVHCVAFAPAGTLLASGSDDLSAILWDVAGSEPVSLPGHQLEVNSLAFAPDGKKLASVSDDKSVRLWDVAALRAGDGSPSVRILRDHAGPVKFVVYAPDGRTFATGGGDRTVRLWDASGQLQAILKEHLVTVRSIAFAPDGRTLATAAGDEVPKKPRPGEIKLWDLATHRERLNLTVTGAVRSVAYSPDGRRLASGGDDRIVRLWDLDQWRAGDLTPPSLPLKGHTDAVRYVAFSSDGRTLASASNDQTVKLWDVSTGTERLTLLGHRAAVLIVVFAPDGKTVTTGSTDGTVKFWDAATGQERAVLEGHKGSIRAVAFASDGKLLATGDNERLVKLWYAATEEQVRKQAEEKRR